MGESSGAEAKRSKSAGKRAPRKRLAKRGTDVGRALRSVYDETLRENVPDDFLDLLGKLS
ncbi:MAG TPA: NepR family anti-sigma factor [Sphingomicrobium sp.]|nr:NepR family anti-sigma factor [Sphingomicrobium sp.]